MKRHSPGRCRAALSTSLWPLPSGVQAQQAALLIEHGAVDGQ